MTGRRLAIGSVGILAGLAAFAMIGGASAEAGLALTFGWVGYLRRVLPQVRVDPDGVATGVLCLALFTAGLHGSLRWLSAEMGRAAGGAPWRWSWRRTFAIVTLVLLMFAVGVAATGIAHQVGWLIAARGSLLETRPLLLGDQARKPSEDRLRSIASVWAYLAEGSGEPVAPGLDEPSPARSWQTRLVPYLDFPSSIGGPLDDTRPWNDPANSAYFRGVVPDFLNPEVGVVRSPEGYALSHYAGNVHVLGRSSSLRDADLHAGRSNTILAGEMATRFKPWGDPSNLVDPALGINRSAEGFGGPDGRRAHLAFADGSVRSFAATTHPEVLRRLCGSRFSR